MIRLAPFLAAAAILLCLARPAFAAGGVLTAPADTVEIAGVRYAMAMSAAQTTRWASLRVGRFPGAMAWILPVRPGARIEEVGDAWLEALELATAPRIVAPGCGDGGTAGSQVIVEQEPPLGTGVRALRSVLLDDVLALRAFAQGWGFDLSLEMDARCEEIVSRGFVLLALVYSGPSGGNATRTVRITDDAFPWVPLLLTAAGDDPLPITTYVLADARTRLGPGAELEVDGSRIAIARDGTTNYAAELRTLLLGARGTSWAAEAASHDLLLEGAPSPAGVDRAPALAPTYFRLAAGDDHTDASDLGIALTGIDVSAAWLTRMSGLIPPHAFGDDLAVTRRDAQRKSPFLAANAAPAACPAPDGGRVGPDGGGPGGPLQPPSPPPSPPPSLPPPTTWPPSQPPPDPHPPVSVGMSCSCSPGPGQPDPAGSDDSCDGSDPGVASPPDEGCSGSADDTSDESCDGAADDTSDESCDGAADDSYDSTDDSCDGSSSSDSGSDDGCSSGSPDGNEDCESGSSQPSEGCSTGRNARASKRAGHAKTSRTRLSVVTLAFTAVALVLRRASKQRRRTIDSAMRLDGGSHGIGPISAGCAAIDGEPQKIDTEHGGVRLDVARTLLGHRRQLEAERSTQHERAEKSGRIFAPPPLVAARVDGNTEASPREASAGKAKGEREIGSIAEIGK